MISVIPEGLLAVLREHDLFCWALVDWPYSFCRSKLFSIKVVNVQQRWESKPVFVCTIVSGVLIIRTYAAQFGFDTYTALHEVMQLT